jgi:Peptidase family S58
VLNRIECHASSHHGHADSQCPQVTAGYFVRVRRNCGEIRVAADQINPVFLATVQATEEAVINALVAAETMTGVNGHTVVALPHDRLREVLQKYNRLLK